MMTKILFFSRLRNVIGDSCGSCEAGFIVENNIPAPETLHPFLLLSPTLPCFGYQISITTIIYRDCYSK